MGLFFNFVVKN